MEVRQAWTIRIGTPACRTSGSTKAAVAEPDESRRGTREGGKANPALLPRTTSDVDVGVTAVGTEIARVARALGAVGVGCELAVAGAARRLAVPVVFGAADVDADALPGFPLLLLLV
jgi:hypothetical protein